MNNTCAWASFLKEWNTKSVGNREGKEMNYLIIERNNETRQINVYVEPCYKYDDWLCISSHAQYWGQWYGDRGRSRISAHYVVTQEQLNAFIDEFFNKTKCIPGCDVCNEKYIPVENTKRRNKVTVSFTDVELGVLKHTAKEKNVSVPSLVRASWLNFLADGGARDDEDDWLELFEKLNISAYSLRT